MAFSHQLPYFSETVQYSSVRPPVQVSSVAGSPWQSSALLRLCCMSPIGPPHLIPHQLRRDRLGDLGFFRLHSASDHRGISQ